MKTLRSIVLVGVASCTLSLSVHATNVAPGSVVNLTGTTVAAEPNLGGSVLNDNLIPFSIPFTPFTSVGGDVQNRVVRSDNLGTLIFAPRIRDTFNIAVTEFHITAFQLFGFGSWATDIEFRTDGLGDRGPTSVSRSLDGDLLTFRYDVPLVISGIAPGPQEESLFPSILTDATAFNFDGRITIFGIDPSDPNNLRSVTISGLAAPVPVPGAVLLLGSALPLIGAWRRRTMVGAR